MRCKYYQEGYCSINCTNDWVKCYICKEYIELINDEDNGYVIYSAYITCDGVQDIENIVMKICPKCYEKIRGMRVDCINE